MLLSVVPSAISCCLGYSLNDMFKKIDFDEPTFADLRLVLRSSLGGSCTSTELASVGPPAKKRCTGLYSDDVRSFYAHKALLASNSPVIKAMLLRAKELRDLHAMGDGISICLVPVECSGSVGAQVSPPARQQTDLQPEILELPMEHEELLACEVLLRSIYSDNLAEEVRSALSNEHGSGLSRVTLLVQVYRLADRLEVCTDQCAQAISALCSADCGAVDVVNNVFSLKRTAPALVDHTVIKELMEMCLSKLVEHFGNISELFWDASLIAEFRQLDFFTVLALLDSNTLIVESENEVLTLMGMWMGKDWADQISKEQLEAFWNILRLGHLTTSFISNLSVVAPWLPVDPVVLGHAAAWKSCRFQNPDVAASMLENLESARGSSVAWSRDRLQSPDDERGAVLSISFLKEDLAKLLTSVHHAGTQEALYTIRDDHSAFNGYDFCGTFSVKVVSDGSKKQFVLSFGFEFGVSAFISKGSQTLVHVKARCLQDESTEEEVCLGEVDAVLDETHSWELTRVDTLEDFSCLDTWLNEDGDPKFDIKIEAHD